MSMGDGEVVAFTFLEKLWAAPLHRPAFTRDTLEKGLNMAG